MSPDQNPLLSELARKFRLRLFRFSGSAERVESFQDQPKHGNVTDLARTLDQITGELGNAPISGIVLITDGADNHSSDLNAAAARLRARNVPVYPVGIGAASFPRDTEVVRVTTPKTVLKDALIEAEVAVRSKGYAGRKTRLEVKEGDRLVYSQEIMLGGNDEVKTFKVSFASGPPGPSVFNFRVQPFSDEIVSENNDQSVLVRVVDDQPQVLYTEGEPRWYYSFLRRALADEKSLRLVTLLRQANGKLLRQGIDSPTILEKGFPADKAELFKYKGLILGSVEASFFTYDQLRLISDFVSQRGGGLVMIGGKNSFSQGGYGNTPLEDALPVVLRAGRQDVPVPSYQDTEFKAVLTDYGQQHPATRLAMDEQDNTKRWESAPPLIGINPTDGLKPGATVLLQSSVREVGGQHLAVLAFQRFGRGKSMALTTDATWRWRMEQDSKNNFHELFWKQLLRWLVSDVPDQVNLDTDKNSYSLDESVTLRAEVNDNTFMRLNNAQITAKVKSPSGVITSVPAYLGSQQRRAVFGDLQAGGGRDLRGDRGSIPGKQQPGEGARQLPRCRIFRGVSQRQPQCRSPQKTRCGYGWALLRGRRCPHAPRGHLLFRYRRFAAGRKRTLGYADLLFIAGRSRFGGVDSQKAQGTCMSARYADIGKHETRGRAFAGLVYSLACFLALCACDFRLGKH